MKPILFFLFVMNSLGFGKNLLPIDANKKVAEAFEGERFCFLLKNKTSTTPSIRLGGKDCEGLYSSSETLFYPLVMLAIEKGLIQDEKTLFKWDGTRYNDKSWNKDQFVTDWLQNRAGWVTDRLLLQIGEESFKKAQERFGFKNPTSAMDLLQFSERFFTQELPIKNNFYDLGRRVFYIGKYRFGSEVWGQKALGKDSAWFAGHLSLQNQRWTVVTLLLPPKNSKEPWSAEKAQALSMDALTQLGLF